MNPEIKERIARIKTRQGSSLRLGLISPSALRNMIKQLWEDQMFLLKLVEEQEAVVGAAKDLLKYDEEFPQDAAIKDILAEAVRALEQE